MKYIKISILSILVWCLCTGCAAGQEKSYTAEDLGNVAQIEVYAAGDNIENRELLKTITDEELLYEYNQCSFWNNSDYSEEHQANLKEAIKGLTEQYDLVSYKYPAAHIHEQTLEKELTLTLYENSTVIKMTVAEESIKNISVSEEYLTFYFDVSAEDLDFLHSLAEDQD